jgi:hypothetical protein
MFFRSFWPLQSCIILSESRLARLVNVNAEDQCTDASVFSLFRSGHEKKVILGLSGSYVSATRIMSGHGYSFSFKYSNNYYSEHIYPVQI